MLQEERSFLGDVGSVWTRRKQIWRLVSRADKLGFGAGVLIMAVVAAVETGIALLIGILFDRVAGFTGRPATEWINFVIFALAALAGAYHPERIPAVAAPLDCQPHHGSDRAQHDGAPRRPPPES